MTLVRAYAAIRISSIAALSPAATNRATGIGSAPGAVPNREPPSLDRRRHDQAAGAVGTEPEPLVVFRITNKDDAVVPDHAGKDDGEHGKLGMVMKGAFVMIERHKPGYKITRTGERGETTFTLSAVR